MWVYAACFGLPAIPLAVYLLRIGQLPWLFDAFPMYGGPWYDIAQPERFAAQLCAFLVMMVAVSCGGWLLWRGLRAGAVVAVAISRLEGPSRARILPAMGAEVAQLTNLACSSAT